MTRPTQPAHPATADTRTERIDRSRLYYGKLLRSMRYSPAWDGKPAYFHVHIHYGKSNRLHMAYLEAPTIPELIAKIKDEGWIVWGSDILDYALPPENALEYLLMEQALKADGLTDDEIRAWFSLDRTEEEAAPRPGDGDPAGGG